MPNYQPLYDENGWARICRDCCKRILKEILEKHNVKRITTKNIDLLLEVVYDFVGTVEKTKSCEQRNIIEGTARNDEEIERNLAMHRPIEDVIEKEN